MVLLWDIFVPVGRLLGRLMDDHPNTIAAYSVNVAGSLVGIWLFVGFSGLGLPPAAWFGAFALGGCYLLGTGGRSKAVDAALLSAVVALSLFAGYEPGWAQTVWSPYQKLSLKDMAANEPSVWSGLRGERAPPAQDIGTHFIAVNNIGYQAMLDLSPRTVAGDPARFPPEQRGCSQYDLPARLHPAPKKLLIVGAGSGNDAAGALRNGVEDVVAVEIDPTIIAMGKAHHPEKPYADSRVRVVNDDARSYFATCSEKFDVIAFGLLDSHTTTAMTNARLDHYVYTRESLQHARTLLNPGGVIVLSFEAQKPFIADRMAKSLEEVFGDRPLVFRVPYNAYGWGGVFFVAGDTAAAKARIAEQPQLAALVTKWEKELPFTLSGTTEVPTDDWPYIYLESRRVPVLYFLLAAGLGVLFLRGVRTLGAPEIVRGWDRTQTHFALMGAAFMLLEVQNISKAAVVLGNTWVVNAVIISGILFMVLLANGLAAVWKRLPLAVVYGLLVASCVGLYFLDLSRFGFLPYATKAAVVGLLTSVPMLFSGIVFIRSFAGVERKDAALGANLFGALAGGLLQSVTFVTGIKALLLIVALFYIGALLTRPKAVRAAV
jgi:SAM-dependent methyltransferase